MNIRSFEDIYVFKSHHTHPHTSIQMRILVRRILCNVNDTRALIGLCLLVTSHLGQISDSWDSHVFTIAQSTWSLASYPFFYSSKDYSLTLKVCAISKQSKTSLITYHIQYTPVARTSASTWFYKHPWITCHKK